MSSDFETVQLIAELAKEVEVEDRIDWGNLNISEKEAYDLISSSVYEQFKNIEHLSNERSTILSVITKLSVQNFVLNLQLMEKQKHSGG